MKIFNEELSKTVNIIPYCFLNLVVSSFFFFLFLSIPEGEYLYFLLISVISVIPLYCVITYSIFAIPVQIFLNRKPKKFNLVYLVFYILCSFVAIFIIFTGLFNVSSIDLLKMERYYQFSFSSALIFWFWDSIFLQRKSDNFGNSSSNLS
ncbi:UPF0715 family protein [Metabacillus niabensis]|uniref:Membrane channel-forming protein YqfA (Hemolysin III family) n=2 Tax=Metabacillus niabensis TaxID=324854 RepID=A0ABT9Z1W8_9BACI|nr:UPF0715 family protein [Metabacillus niabensis]MDQ0226202.1 putative membrane channel-forming protein YqfA (hemolysin III family) [Metabacillus niabensis]